MAPKYDVVVVGGGLSGLVTAYQLFKQGVSVALVEKNKTSGGVIDSATSHNYLTETGPHTFQSTATELCTLAQELGLTLHPASSKAKNRYIYKNNQLLPVPTGPGSFVTTPLLSLMGKLRLLAEPFQNTHNVQEETVASFIERRLGLEVLQSLAGPFLSGVYAGDPQTLSAQAIFPALIQWEKDHGSLLGGLIHKIRHRSSKKHQKTPYQLLSFTSGMKALPQALLHALPQENVYLAHALETLNRTDEGTYRLNGSGGLSLNATHLVLATPAYTAGELLKAQWPQLATQLHHIPYAPMAVVHLAFKRKDIPHDLDGFGFLVPRTEGIDTLGAIWTSSLFPERCPPDHALLSCFIGGATQPEVRDWTEEQYITQVITDIKTILNLKASVEPDFIKSIFYNHAIPQYNLGHNHRIAEIQHLVSAQSNLWLVGNYLSGVSLNDCVKQGSNCAQKILEQ